MPAPKKRPGPKPGAKVKPPTDREKFVAKRQGRGTGDGEWRVVNGIRRFFPKK